jgi:two-component system, OmpR family, phosphate regulon sensor histidine kinase PhoR
LTFWLVILVGCILVGAFLVYFRFIQPLIEIRGILRRLANGDFRPVLLSAPRRIFRETSADVRRISELLQQLDQQITDEGFSLKAILSSMAEGVIITDRAQRIRLVNQSLQQMFALTRSPINSTVIEVFFKPELQKIVEETLFDGIVRNIEISIESPAPDGYTTKHFEVSASGLNPRPKARALGTVIVFHDITTIKNLEAARREFVANVSHEFRTPLTIITGYIETLLEGAIEDRATTESWLRVMAKNGRRLTFLIEDLLTLSQLEHRSPQLHFQKINLAELLNRVIERITPAISERHGKVSVEWASSAAWVEADPYRMEQVFENILENAVRHAVSEGVVVMIKAQSLGEEIEIVFSDNGPGIPYADQPHIFERFYRVHKDRTRLAGGTGLGLSIAKHVVLAHRGVILVESVPGRGTSFKIRLPRLQQTSGRMETIKLKNSSSH